MLEARLADGSSASIVEAYDDFMNALRQMRDDPSDIVAGRGNPPLRAPQYGEFGGDFGAKEKPCRFWRPGSDRAYDWTCARGPRRVLA